MSEPQQCTLIALADAVVAAIQGQPEGTFGLAFTAGRQVVPLVDLKAIGDAVRVDVVGVGLAEDRIGGGPAAVFSGDYNLDVIVTRRVGAGTDADAKAAALLLLAQQLRDLFKRVVVTVGARRAILSAIDADPAYGMATLIEKHCFVGLQSWTFRLLV
jgi:hypothetical protein